MRTLGLLIAGALVLASTAAVAHDPNRGGGAGRCQVPGPNHQIRVVRVQSAQECRAAQQREANRFRHRQTRKYQNEGHGRQRRDSGAGNCQVPGPNGQLRLVRVRSKRECRVAQQREAQRFGRRQHRRTSSMGAVIGAAVGAAIGHQFDH